LYKDAVIVFSVDREPDVSDDREVEKALEETIRSTQKCLVQQKR
jgi:hypothetical protein